MHTMFFSAIRVYLKIILLFCFIGFVQAETEQLPLYRSVTTICDSSISPIEYSFSSDDSSWVNISIFNNSCKNLLVMPKDLGLDLQRAESLILVDVDSGDVIKYTGLLSKKAFSKQKNYSHFFLKAGSSVTANFKLANFFELELNSCYSITYQGFFIDTEENQIYTQNSQSFEYCYELKKANSLGPG